MTVLPTDFVRQIDRIFFYKTVQYLNKSSKQGDRKNKKNIQITEKKRKFISNED